MHAASAGVLGKCWFETETQVIFEEINSAPFTESSSPDKNTSHTHAVTTNTEMIVVSHHVSQQCPAGVTQGKRSTYSPLLPCEKKTATSALFIISVFRLHVTFYVNDVVFGMPAGSKCCFSQYEEFQHPEEEFTGKSETTNNINCEQPLYKPQNLYKQLWAPVIKQTYAHVSSEYEFIGVIFDCQSLCSWFCVVSAGGGSTVCYWMWCWFCTEESGFLQDAIPYVRRTLRKCGLRPEDID